jgi:hypothetical protein
VWGAQRPRNQLPAEPVEILKSSEYRMVTQVSGTYTDLCTWDNLYAAYRKASKGKRSRQGSAGRELMQPVPVRAPFGGPDKVEYFLCP